MTGVPNLRRYLHYDVFTATPHAGNQLAVFTDPAGLATEAMAAMTREMNYSECTFVFPRSWPAPTRGCASSGAAARCSLPGIP